MKKNYQNRAMKTEFAPAKFVPVVGQYFYPKAPGGPIVIVAGSQQEADELFDKSCNK